MICRSIEAISRAEKAIPCCCILRIAVWCHLKTQVAWRKPVEKELDCIPETIIRKFKLWVSLVEESGIREVRKHKGFHDEPLKGNRYGRDRVQLKAPVNQWLELVYPGSAGDSPAREFSLHLPACLRCAVPKPQTHFGGLADIMQQTARKTAFNRLNKKKCASFYCGKERPINA
jgi:hypothetical protein